MINLLLIDDDFDFLNTLSSILKRDFQVSTAAGVIEAKQIFMSKAVDAVCTDFNMRDAFLTNMVKRYGATFCGKTDCDLIEKIKNVINSKTMQHLPDDGKRKKPSFSRHIDMPIK